MTGGMRYSRGHFGIMSRFIIPAPHCHRCSDSDMRLPHIERHTNDLGCVPQQTLMR